MADIKIDIDCPECDRGFKVTMKDIAAQRSVRCPNGHTVKLIDKGGGMGKVQRALDDFGA